MKKLPYTFLFLTVFLSSAYADRVYWYNATSLTGGATSSADSINGQNLINNDKLIVVTASGQTHIYNLDSDSALDEDSTNYSVISPDLNAGDKRWILVWRGGRVIIPDSTIDQSDDSIVGTLAWHVADSASNIRIIKGDYTATDTITLSSNLYIYAEAGTTFSKSEDGTNIGFIRMVDASNVTIDAYNTEWKYTTKPTSDEQRHIFDIRGSSVIRIFGAAANDSGGDGFYVGPGTSNAYCEDVILRDISADNNRRQGMSITSVKGIRVINPRFTGTTGTSPAAGIDLEPNDNDAFMEDIIIENPYTEGNDGIGITIGLNGIAGAVDKDIGIRIINHTDKESSNGIVIYKLDLDGNEVSGSIVIENPISIDPDLSAFTSRNYDSDGPRVDIINPTAIRPNESSNATVKYGSAFIVFRESTDSGATTIGNVHFYNPTIKDDRGTPEVLRYFYCRDETAQDDVVNVTIDGQITGEGITGANNMIDFYGSGRIEDKDNLIIHDMNDAGLSIERANYIRKVHNASNPGLETVTLDASIPAGWPDVTFEVQVGQLLRIDPDGASHIYPGSTGVGMHIESDTIGSRLVLRRISTTVWYIVEQIGTWVFETP